jgi:CO/xanthine dehydrogenase Mo-binding subunit
VIGQSPRRKEDERLVTGRGRFIDDIAPPGVVHLAVVRSTHAHARIVAVDAAQARRLPGVAVFLADDLPGLAEPLPAARADRTNPYVRLDTPRSQPPLARGEVRYVGEPIAAVVGSDPYLAADAAEMVRIEYEPSTSPCPPSSTPRPRWPRPRRRCTRAPATWSARSPRSSATSSAPSPWPM